MAFYHTACFVFTVLIVCNAVLYPNVFSNIFKQWFGGKTPAKNERESMPEYPPHMRPGGGRGRGGRMAPHPGMGGAGRQAEYTGPRPGPVGDSSVFMSHQQQESSRGKGMMGTVLPVYAVGIFVYFGYVIYKVFLRDKPVTQSSRPNWDGREESFQEGPTLQRQQEEALQRQLAAELKAANYPEWKKKTTTKGTEEIPHSAATQGHEEDVDALRKRLEETEKTMQRMMDMMNSMGLAMNQVTQHIAANEKPIHGQGDSKQNEDDDHESIDVSDEEDLIVGDKIDIAVDSESDDDGNADTLSKDSRCEDIHHRKKDEMNGVHDVDDDDVMEEKEEGMRPEVQNITSQDAEDVHESLRRRNITKEDDLGIEG